MRKLNDYPISVNIMNIKEMKIPFLQSLLLLTLLILTGGDPLTAGGTSSVQPPAKGIDHVRVLWMENPSSEAVISWSTREEGKKHRVYYDTEPRGGEPDDYAKRQKTFRDGKFTTVDEDVSWTVPTYYHHVYLDKLKPATPYYLVIESDDAVSREFHFVTAPEKDEPLAILHGGDSRIGAQSGPSGGLDPYDHNDRQKMNLRMATLLEDHPGIIALAHGGDYCLRAELRFMDRWLTDFELTTTKEGRLLPIIPTRGNHDKGVGFEEIFAWPDLKTDYYYTTKLSEEIALITLNTELSIGGDQRDWLEKNLDALRRNNRWVFTQYHQPAYTSVKNPQRSASQLTYWVPLFEKYNVDLVCESDDHALKRTLPIRNGAPDLENGIVYIGDGGLGVPQRTPDPSRWWLQKPGFAKSAHHVFMLQFNQKEMRGRAFGMDGEVLDDFRLTPKAVMVHD